MLKHITIHVYGRVQGVFFRASARDEARKLGIYGTIENKPDGSVFIEATGEKDSLDQLSAWCRKGGPPMGRADKILISPGQDMGWKDFDIIY